MINSQSSRRNFLGSLAILSAGSALGSITRLVSETPAPDLYGEWKQFCRQNGGQFSSLSLPGTATFAPCKGHWYETGETIAFPRHNLLAQPTWVFWSETKNKPADMLITLYENDADKTKLGRLNRFEWEALLALPEGPESQDVVALMKKAGKPPATVRKSNTVPPLKVVVRKGRNVSITTRLTQQEITIKKQFSYSV
jgi:hypothetical protein